MAQDARDQADHYRSLGGVGYKTGLEQRADAEAARYSALAAELAAAPQSAEAQQKPEAATGTAPPATQEASPNCSPTKPAVLAPECNR